MSRRRKFEDTDQSPEEYAMWTAIYAEGRAARREAREAGRQQTYAAVQPAYSAPFAGLKRGPKPDPDRQCTEKVLTIRVTKREAAELKKHHRKLCADVSPSTFYRFVLCQWLQAHKSKDAENFAFDPVALDWRSKQRRTGAASEASTPTRARY